MVTAEHADEVSRGEISRCKELADTLGVADAIQWHTDFLTDEGSHSLLRECDLLVLPHRQTPELASGAVRIALASSRPVLTTPVAIFNELGDAVIRASGLDSGALASAITAALQNYKLRDKTVDEAERWMELHDWARMSERLYGMICGLLENNGAI